MEPLTSEDRSKLTRTARRLAEGASWEAIAVILGFEAERLRDFIDAHQAEFSRLLNRAYRETVTEALFEGIAVICARLNSTDPAESRRAAECLIRVGLAFRRERANRLKSRRQHEPWPEDDRLEPLAPLRELREPHAVTDRSRPTHPSPTPTASSAPKAEAKPPAPRPQAQPRVPFASEKIEAFVSQTGTKAKQRFDPAVAANWGISVQALQRIATGESENGK